MPSSAKFSPAAYGQDCAALQRILNRVMRDKETRKRTARLLLASHLKAALDQIQQEILEAGE